MEAVRVLVKYRSLLAVAIILMILLPNTLLSLTDFGRFQSSLINGRGSNLPRNGGTNPEGLGSNPSPRSDSYNESLKVRIAAVEPVFTTTAYSSFYNFYSKYSSKVVNGPIRTELNLLNASLVHGWGWSEGLHRFLESKTTGQQYDIALGRNLSFISEVDVKRGILFGAGGTRNYDVVILGFTEYVTSQEYYAYKSFVTTGGLLVLLDATNFLAEVQYYPRTQHLALIRGHGWGFNGTLAKRDIFDRWQSEDSNWIGSTFGLGSTSEASYNGAMPLDQNSVGRALKEKYGHRVFTSYHGHEENIVSNFTRTSIIAHWVHTGKRGLRPNVCAYLHYYRSSYVAQLGVMGSDVIETDESVQFFLAQIVLFAARQSKEIGSVVYSMGPFQVSFRSNPWMGRIIFNGKGYLNGETGTYPYGNILASSNPPAEYIFDGWNASGRVVLTILLPTRRRSLSLDRVVSEQSSDQLLPMMSL